MDEQRPRDIPPEDFSQEDIPIEDTPPELQPLQQSANPMPQPSSPKRLYRSSHQKMFLGVCGGLGEYFDLDPTLVRIIFVVTTLLGGASIAVYAVLALIMPSEASLDLDPRAAAHNTVNVASEEVRKGVDIVVTRVKGMTGRGATTATPEPPPMPPPPASSPDPPDAPTTRIPPAS